MCKRYWQKGGAIRQVRVVRVAPKVVEVEGTAGAEMVAVVAVKALAR